MNPDQVVEIVVRDGKAKGASATGYVIVDNRILTTGHLGSDATLIAVGSSVNVRFVPKKPDDDVPEEDAKVIWSGADLDCAILECKQIPQRQRGVEFSVQYEVLSAEARFVCHAWCNAGTEGEESRRVTELSGTAHRMNSVQDWLSLDCGTTAPADLEAWQGGSGAAVFVGDKLAGILRGIPEQFRNQKAYAVPICRLTEDSEFMVNSGFAATEETRQSQVQNKIKDKVQIVATKLQKITDVWDQLIRITETKSLADEVETRESVADRLIETPDLVFGLEELRADAVGKKRVDDASTIAEMQDLLLTLMLPRSVRHRLYYEIDIHGAAIVEGAAATPVGAELAAAHSQERSTS